VTQSDIKTVTWPAYRVTRLLRIMEYKSQGLTDKQVAAKQDMPSAATVSRDLNSPQAAEIGKAMIERATSMIWPLIERQMYQIEQDIDLATPQRIIYRGKLIALLINLVPQKIEQKVQGDLSFTLEAWRPEPEEDEKDEND